MDFGKWCFMHTHDRKMCVGVHRPERMPSVRSFCAVPSRAVDLVAGSRELLDIVSNICTSPVTIELEL